jgi:GntR family transcriptional repressor for pyruvate dehydrogenase complex
MASNHDRFRPVERSLTPRRIVEQFQHMIATKQLAPGDRLPPERVLASLLGVGRSTMREAMRALESLGLIETRPGQGTFLRATDTPLTIVARPALSCPDYRSLLEARRVIEPPIAGLAATRVSPEAIQRLRQTLAAEAAELTGGGTGIEQDLAFHRGLSRMTGNPTLRRFQESMEEALQTGRVILEKWASRMQIAHQEHEAILAAIVEGNSARAEQAMAVHLEAVQAWAAGLPCWCGGCTTPAG